jgi:glutamyl-tRNA reductase
MSVWALGINHTTAPLDLRGRFAFALDQIAPTLHGLRQSLSQNAAACGAVETAIISTCNRTEIYCAGERPALDHTLGWLAHSGGVSTEVLRSHIPTAWKTAPWRATPSAWPAGSIPWCWVRPRSWAR